MARWLYVCPGCKVDALGGGPPLWYCMWCQRWWYGTQMPDQLPEPTPTPPGEEA